MNSLGNIRTRAIAANPNPPTRLDVADARGASFRVGLRYPPPFIEAAHYTPVGIGMRSVDLVVLHATQGPERSGSARALGMNVFSLRCPDRLCSAHPGLVGPGRKASSHYGVDAAEVVQYVREGDVAWAAPGANQNGIHIEVVGRSEQTPDEWRDEYSMGVLHLSVMLCANVCRAWGIPASLVDAAGLLVRRRGITTHAEVSRAFRRSDHWDPGPGFPISWYCDRVRGLLAEGIG